MGYKGGNVGNQSENALDGGGNAVNRSKNAGI